LNKRDTQFQGFAKALWDELVQANSYGYIDVNEDDDGIDPTNYRQLLARRAYDLALHTTDKVRGTISRNPAFVLEHNVPDLTELPEEETEA
jgi:hypothetical protein